MEVLYPHCAGLDVHKDTVTACVRHMVDGVVNREVRTFDTTTPSRLACGRAMHACGHGSYGGLLEAGLAHPRRWRFELVLANAKHVKNVPGPQDRRQ
jgi:transposase